MITPETQRLRDAVEAILLSEADFGQAPGEYWELVEALKAFDEKQGEVG